MEKSNIEILQEIFKPVSQDCQTPKQDLQLAITLNPDLELILKAMEMARDFESNLHWS